MAAKWELNVHASISDKENCATVTADILVCREDGRVPPVSVASGNGGTRIEATAAAFAKLDEQIADFREKPAPKGD